MFYLINFDAVYEFIKIALTFICYATQVMLRDNSFLMSSYITRQIN